MISVSFFRLFRVMRLVKLLSKVQYSRHAGTAHTIQQRRNSTTNYSARYSTEGTLAQHTQYNSIVIVPPTTQQGTVQKAHWPEDGVVYPYPLELDEVLGTLACCLKMVLSIHILGNLTHCWLPWHVA